MVSTSESEPIYSGFESVCCRFEVWAISFIPLCPSSPNCINEYLAIDRVVNE